MADIRRTEQAPTPTSTYTDPISALFGNIDRLYDAFGGRNAGPTVYGTNPFAGAARNSVVVPQLDVHESDKAITVSAELPGLSDEDIDLAIEEGVLTLKGVKKSERTEGDEDYPRLIERNYGSFQRSLRLPDTADESNASAKFENGVLRVTIPKKPESTNQKRRIAIER